MRWGRTSPASLVSYLSFPHPALLCCFLLRSTSTVLPPCPVLTVCVRHKLWFKAALNTPKPPCPSPSASPLPCFAALAAVILVTGCYSAVSASLSSLGLKQNDSVVLPCCLFIHEASFKAIFVSCTDLYLGTSKPLQGTVLLYSLFRAFCPPYYCSFSPCKQSDF